MCAGTGGPTVESVPRYVIERSLPDGLEIAVDEVLAHNADVGVTWLHSYVSADGLRSFDVYEAPTPEAIRKTSARNGLPLDRITEVRVLEPHPFGPSQEVRR
jgi:hypothetical protein